jgi:hypothetical protein
MRTVEVTAGEIEIHTVGEVILLSTFSLGDDVEMTADQAQKFTPGLARPPSNRVARLEAGSLRRSCALLEARPMATTTMILSRFHCPDCCLGDREVGEISDDETFCVVCWESTGS